MNPSATSESPPARSRSTNALVSPRKRDMWVCMPEPCTPASGLGMKLANTPCWRAISFTTSRTVITVSAMVMASVYRRSISCWLGASSCWACSTGMPISSRVRTVRWRMSLARSATVSSK